ncbi:lipopolysaccharide core heptose(I) kinase RfaP, partial [Escherichia coli]|nr:lipopolysaccharide core heptose(I) kinase RfaP [Escherichia coli]
LHLPFTGREDELKISVIDLHRAQIRAKVPRRWRDKDLIGLYFSSMNIGLTQRDIWRFMKVYFGMPLRDIFKLETDLLKKAKIKAKKIEERTIRKNL